MHKSKRFYWRLGCILAYAATLTACGVDGLDALRDLAGAGETAACGQDPRVLKTTVGARGEGSRVFTFVLQACEPTPAAVGTNTWTLQLLDEAQAPVYDAMLGAEIAMPDGLTGSSQVVQVQASGDTYVLSPLTFARAGVWQVTVSARHGTTSDQAVFTYCVDG